MHGAAGTVALVSREGAPWEDIRRRLQKHVTEAMAAYARRARCSGLLEATEGRDGSGEVVVPGTVDLAPRGGNARWDAARR
jgi:hypothetical protein